MRMATCAREQEMLRAARSGELAAEQRRHLAGCDACRDATLVAGWLATAVRVEERTVSLPDPQDLWWRSRVVRELCEKEHRIDRRTWPLTLVQGVATSVVVVTTVVALAGTETVVGLLNTVLGIAGAVGDQATVPAALLGAAVVSLGAGAVMVWRLSTELG